MKRVRPRMPDDTLADRVAIPRCPVPRRSRTRGRAPAAPLSTESTHAPLALAAPRRRTGLRLPGQAPDLRLGFGPAGDRGAHHSDRGLHLPALRHGLRPRGPVPDVQGGPGALADRLHLPGGPPAGRTLGQVPALRGQRARPAHRARARAGPDAGRELTVRLLAL